jgi:hypothetical protein
MCAENQIEYQGKCYYPDELSAAQYANMSEVPKNTPTAAKKKVNWGNVAAGVGAAATAIPAIICAFNPKAAICQPATQETNVPNTDWSKAGSNNNNNNNKSGGGGMPTWAWVVIGVVAVGGIAALIYFTTRK